MHQIGNLLNILFFLAVVVLLYHLGAWTWEALLPLSE